VIAFRPHASFQSQSRGGLAQQGRNTATPPAHALGWCARKGRCTTRVPPAGFNIADRGQCETVIFATGGRAAMSTCACGHACLRSAVVHSRQGANRTSSRGEQ
jgi:hypothetical protein